MEESKALVHDDESGFLFAKEMLAGDVTAAVNFDRFMKHPEKGFIIMEYLLCEEEQMQKHNTYYTQTALYKEATLLVRFLLKNL